MNLRLLRVETEYFVAGAVFERVAREWSCTRAAPIIDWMVGKYPGETKLALLRMDARWQWLSGKPTG